MFSPGYLEELRTLNANGQGGKGFKWADQVLALCEKFGGKWVLDYGCGRGTLGANIRGKVRCWSFDPAVEHFARRPRGEFDLVVCTDVLEHVELAYITPVLEDMAGFMRKGAHGFFVISTKESNKLLSDGRNAHVTIRGPNWWKSALGQHFDLVAEPALDLHKQYVAVVRSRK